MKQFITTVYLFLIGSASLFSNTFYIDPANGAIGNDGSEAHPWSTLQEVVDGDFIESYSYNPLPYSATSTLVIKNQDAPVKAGDTLVLKSGWHGNIYLRGYYNSATITVISAEGAFPTLEKLRLVACSKWKFVGMYISSEPTGIYNADNLIHIESHNWHGPSKNIEIEQCNIFSTSTPWTVADDWVQKASDGILVNGDSISIHDNILRNVKFGLMLRGENIDAFRNQITNFSGDGVRVSGSYIRVEYNTIKNAYAVDANHDDGIQSFTTGGLTVDNNIIRGNIIINYEDPNQPLLGDLQGIGCFDGPYHNWVVENNLIIVNHWHGISFYGAYDCKIINNTVLDPTPQVAPGGSWIKVTDNNGIPSSGCIVKNNVANSYDVDGEESNNYVLNTQAEYAENFVDFANYDFHLLGESVLVDAGDAAMTPEFDLELAPRISGNFPDIGAYEYQYPSNTTNVDFSKLSNISIFPNPAAAAADINFENLPVPCEISVHDVVGKRLMQKITHSNFVQMDFSSFQKGIYFITFKNKAARVMITKKIMVL